MNKNIEYLIISERYLELSKYIELGIVKMEDAVNELIHLNDAFYIYRFAWDVKDAPIDKLADAVIAAQNAKYIYRFAWDVKDAPINKLADAVIAAQNAEYIYEFARNVKDAPINKLADAIVATQNAEYIYKFAGSVCVAPKDQLADAIAATQNAEYIYKFAHDLYGFSINKLVDAIIATQNAEYIYKFARDIGSAPVDRLANVLIDMQNAEYIANFILDISTISVETFKNLVETFLVIGNAHNIWDFILKYNQYIKKRLNEVFYPRNIMKELFQKLVAKKDMFYIKELLKLLSVEEVTQYVLETNDADFIVEFKTFVSFCDNNISIYSLSDASLFQYLAKLYKANDFENIRKNREVFSSLFQNEEEIIRK